MPLTTATLLTVTPLPETATVAPGIKFVPARVTFTAAPCRPLFGVTEDKVGALFTAVTVSVTVVVCVNVPEVPVIVTVAAPTVALLEAVSVSVLVLVVLAGLNDALTPEGKPLADSATDPANPPTPVTVMLLLPLAPCATLTLLGEAVKE